MFPIKHFICDQCNMVLYSRDAFEMHQELYCKSEVEALPIAQLYPESENRCFMNILQDINIEQRTPIKVANVNAFNYVSTIPLKESTKPETNPLLSAFPSLKKTNYASVEEFARKYNGTASNELLTMSDLCLKKTGSSMTPACSNLSLLTTHNSDTFLNAVESNTALGSQSFINIPEMTNVEGQTSNVVHENSNFVRVSSKRRRKASKRNKVLLMTNNDSAPDGTSYASIEENSLMHTTAALDESLANSDTERTVTMKSDKHLLAPDGVHEDFAMVHSDISMAEAHIDTQESAIVKSLPAAKETECIDNTFKSEKQPTSSVLNEALIHEIAELDLSSKQNERNESDIMDINHNKSKNALISDQQRSVSSSLVARLSKLHSRDTSENDKFIIDTEEFLRTLKEAFPTGLNVFKQIQGNSSTSTFKNRPISSVLNNLTREIAACHLSNTKSIKNECNLMNMNHDGSRGFPLTNQQRSGIDSIETLQSVFPTNCLSLAQTQSGVVTPMSILQQRFASEAVNVITNLDKSENVFSANQQKSFAENRFSNEDETNTDLTKSETKNFGEILRSAISVLNTQDMFDSNILAQRSVFQENDYSSSSGSNQQLSTVPFTDQTLLVQYQTLPVQNIFGPVKECTKYATTEVDHTLPMSNSSSSGKSTADSYIEKHSDENCGIEKQENIAIALPSHQNPDIKFSTERTLSVQNQTSTIQELFLSVRGSTDCAAVDARNSSTLSD